MLRGKEFGLGIFEPQQELLCLIPAAITGQGAVATDNPMTGNDNRKGILTDCSSHSSDRFRIANRLSDVSVRANLSVRDFFQGLLYLDLKRGADWTQGQIKVTALTFKVFLQLSNGLANNGIFPGDPIKSGESFKSFDDGVMVPAVSPVSHDELISNSADSQLTAGRVP